MENLFFKIETCKWFLFVFDVNRQKSHYAPLAYCPASDRASVSFKKEVSSTMKFCPSLREMEQA